MSKIKADTLSNLAGTKEVPVDTVVQGSAKAWVNFNGTGTVAIRAAFNVTSITDNGTGDYTVNFTAALPDANYATNITGNNSNGAATIQGVRDASAAPTTGAVRLYTLDTGGASLDISLANVSVFR